MKNQAKGTQFLNKVVIVTGASRGIGREIALSFARQGAKLVLASRTIDNLKEAEREVKSLGVDAFSCKTDVSSRDSVDSMIGESLGHFGRIDVLVNNAGIARVGRVESNNFEADLRETLKASLFGMIYTTQAVLPILRKQNSGTIVNMSSVMGRKAFANFGSYAIVMHGVSAFTDALRQELAGTNINVSVIHPALTATTLLKDAPEEEMPPPFRHLTPLPAEIVGAAVVETVRNCSPRLVLPATANMLLLGEALSPRLGDAIADGLAKGTLAKLLGLSSGKTYQQTIASI